MDIMRVIGRGVWEGECLLWPGASTGSNAKYGITYDDDGRQVYVHRLVYEHLVGPIPEGHEIDHVAERGCASKLCFNPEHLEPVTHRENRRRARLTVCRSGEHDLTDPKNVLWDSAGNRRGCYACSKKRQRERYHAGKTKAGPTRRAE